MNELVLTGLDGANPLAFLAALGTLRTLDRAWPSETVRLRWQPNSAWNPAVCTARSVSQDELIAALDTALRQMAGHPAFSIADDLKIAPAAYSKDYAKPAAETAFQSRDRIWADFVAAFGSDVSVDAETIQKSKFQFITGQGNQHFLKTMRELVQSTSAEHLRKALFEPWRYEDDKPSLRWDPADDRRYALRWDDPSGDPIRTVRGANRLAVEGLPLLPTMPVPGSARIPACSGDAERSPLRPVGYRLETTGFSGRGSRDTFWTWPLWSAPLSLDAVRSVLALRQLQETAPPRPELEAMGIREVYRSQRLTVQKYRNFAPARVVG